MNITALVFPWSETIKVFLSKTECLIAKAELESVSALFTEATPKLHCVPVEVLSKVLGA